jgi:hypothetical protein
MTNCSTQLLLHCWVRHCSLQNSRRLNWPVPN